jgi:hypothetical protein
MPTLGETKIKTVVKTLGRYSYCFQVSTPRVFCDPSIGLSAYSGLLSVDVYISRVPFSQGQCFSFFLYGRADAAGPCQRGHCAFLPATSACDISPPLVSRPIVRPRDRLCVPGAYFGSSLPVMAIHVSVESSDFRRFLQVTVLFNNRGQPVWSPRPETSPTRGPFPSSQLHMVPSTAADPILWVCSVWNDPQDHEPIVERTRDTTRRCI